jgi:hypothetical protein
MNAGRISTSYSIKGVLCSKKRIDTLHYTAEEVNHDASNYTNPQHAEISIHLHRQHRDRSFGRKKKEDSVITTHEGVSEPPSTVGDSGVVEPGVIGLLVAGVMEALVLGVMRSSPLGVGSLPKMM